MDKRKLTLLIIGLTMAGITRGAPELSDDDRRELARLEAENSIDVDGKINPELVPYAVRMKLFFFGYPQRYSSALKARLSPNDQAVLTEYAGRHSDAVRQNARERAIAFANLAASAEDMDGLELATKMEAIFQASQAENEARYREVLSKLSPEGRSLVEQFAFDHIRPSTTLSNQVAVAAAAPDLYKAAVIEARKEDEEEAARPATRKAADEASRNSLPPAPATAQSQSSPQVKAANH